MSKNNCMMISFAAEILSLDKIRHKDKAASDIIAKSRVFQHTYALV